MRYLILSLALFLIACGAQPTVTQAMERSGPVRLVCLNPDGLIEHVNRLTRQQILIGVTVAARNGRIEWPCDDVQLPVGTVWTGHARWIQTQDGYWIHGLTLRFPNGGVVVAADPMNARLGSRPVEFYNFYNYDYQCAPGITCPDTRRSAPVIIPGIPDRDGGSFGNSCAPGDKECTRRQMERLFKRN